MHCVILSLCQANWQLPVSRGTPVFINVDHLQRARSSEALGLYKPNAIWSTYSMTSIQKKNAAHYVQNQFSPDEGCPSPVLPLCSVLSTLPAPSIHPVGNPLWLAAAAALAFPAHAAPAPSQPEFYDPRIRGGEMLNNASRHGGEPLNVTPSVLTDAGFLGYAGALGLCPANLGDGHGWVDEGKVLREDFGSAAIGTCWESVVGGNLLRYLSTFFSSLPSSPLLPLILADSCPCAQDVPLCHLPKSTLPPKP
ncbi:hypothetical protein B0H13DRAFT_2362033 [Mycena leptocephala]|nr:hypothetical protein B0H13DRAFT_2362033 [Mycena leptocephala]